MKKKTLWITAAAVTAVVIGGSAVAAAVASEGGGLVAVPAATSPVSSLDADADLAQAAEAALAEVPGTVVDVDHDDDSAHAYEVDIRRADGTEAEVRLDAAFGVLAVRDDDRDDGGGVVGRDGRGASPGASSAPAGDAERAGAAALAHIGRGTVVEVDRDDDPGIAWEVEIELPDGEDVDVELDAQLRVVAVK